MAAGCGVGASTTIVNTGRGVALEIAMRVEQNNKLPRHARPTRSWSTLLPHNTPQRVP
jgi:hypothetical protein